MALRDSLAARRAGTHDDVVERFDHPLLSAAGKARAACAVLRGNMQALTMIPRTIRKRRRIRHLRKLSNRQIHRLLLQYRISLKELMEHAI